MSSYFPLILGIAIVTYIPRLIPFTLVSKKSMNPTLKKFLTYVPYATLGALIIPDAFTFIPNNPLAAWGGVITAFLLSWLKGNIVLSVLASVGATFLLLQYL
ncbi:MAG: AzlD domain-containing protein [Epulopiscium sp.]|nr:AzlD domain-containing protein [Candidatus Epulonipiscium sp.]